MFLERIAETTLTAHLSATRSGWMSRGLQAGREPGFCKQMIEALMEGAEAIYCSTGSQAVLGVTPDNAADVLVGGLELNWSGPPGVIELSSNADVSLTY